MKIVYYTSNIKSIPIVLSETSYAYPLEITEYRPGCDEFISTLLGRFLVYREGVGVTCTEEECCIKSTDGFGGSIDKAYAAYAEWQKRGWKGAPFSFGSFCRQSFDELKKKGVIKTKSCASANHYLRDYFSGGWIETRVTGFVNRPIWHYDINQAYSFAATLGLPSITRPYVVGTDCLGYVVSCELDMKANDIAKLPNFFSRGERVLVTSEEVSFYGLKIKNSRGVCYDDLDFNPGEILLDLASLPYNMFKKCTQSFWGTWAGFDGVGVKKGNKEWVLKNRHQNAAWASLIVRRVAMSVFSVMEKSGISCYVDSVLSTIPLATGDDSGEWKQVAVYPNGIYIEAPGVFCELPVKSWDKRTWTKHAGTKNA